MVTWTFDLSTVFKIERGRFSGVYHADSTILIP